MKNYFHLDVISHPNQQILGHWSEVSGAGSEVSGAGSGTEESVEREQRSVERGQSFLVDHMVIGGWWWVSGLSEVSIGPYVT